MLGYVSAGHSDNAKQWHLCLWPIMQTKASRSKGQQKQRQACQKRRQTQDLQASSAKKPIAVFSLLINRRNDHRVWLHMNSMKLVIPLHSLYWSIHTKDESKRGTAFAFIFGVNWFWRCGVTASFGVFFSWNRDILTRNILVNNIFSGFQYFG